VSPRRSPLIDNLHELSEALDAPSRARASATPHPRIETRRIPLLSVLGTGAVFALTWLPVAAPLRAALVLASGLPMLAHATQALARRRRVDGQLLDASTFGLLVLRGNWPAAALLPGLRALGDYIVAKSVVTTRRSGRPPTKSPTSRYSPSVSLTARSVARSGWPRWGLWWRAASTRASPSSSPTTAPQLAWGFPPPCWRP